MELREDEIEALLKFDYASLKVVKHEDSPTKKNPYVAIVKQKDGKAFAGNGESRIQAVHDVWGVYQKFISTPLCSRDDTYWVHENVVAEVELQLIKNQQEKQHG